MFMRIALTSSIAISTALAAPVQAADLDSIIYAPELAMTQPVEIGSGWYLRGDLGYQLKTKYRSTVAAATNPFQGLVPFTPTGFLTNQNDYAKMSASIGAGYHLNDLFRVDFNLATLGQNSFGQTGVFTGGCGGTRTVTTTNYVAGVPVVPVSTTSSSDTVNCDGGISVKNSMYLGMLNGYVDLGTFAGFTPYVGGGVGVAYTKQTASANGTCEASQLITGTAGVSQTSNTFLCSGQSAFPSADVNANLLSYTEDQWSVAYSLNAGLGYQLSKNLSLDMGYQFTSAPNAKYADFNGTSITHKKGINVHEVRVGLRYDLW